MTDNKTSEAQLRASKKWNEKNKEVMSHIRNRSGCKKYIEKATLEELAEIETLIESRRNDIKKIGSIKLP